VKALPAAVIVSAASVASPPPVHGYALLNTPARPHDLAERCKAPDAPKNCAGDVTGTIPPQPKR
jgi:hypothetical protein